jgi:hypothetical protein
MVKPAMTLHLIQREAPAKVLLAMTLGRFAD